MLLATVALMVVAASAVATAATPMGETSTHVRANLEPRHDSGVHGTVHLFQLPSGGTQIVVLAQGLTPGKRYISLYYDNPAATSNRTPRRMS